MGRHTGWIWRTLNSFEKVKNTKKTFWVFVGTFDGFFFWIIYILIENRVPNFSLFGVLCKRLILPDYKSCSPSRNERNDQYFRKFPGASHPLWNLFYKGKIFQIFASNVSLLNVFYISNWDQVPCWDVATQRYRGVVTQWYSGCNNVPTTYSRFLQIINDPLWSLKNLSFRRVSHPLALTRKISTTLAIGSNSFISGLKF